MSLRESLSLSIHASPEADVSMLEHLIAPHWQTEKQRKVAACSHVVFSLRQETASITSEPRYPAFIINPWLALNLWPNESSCQTGGKNASETHKRYKTQVGFCLSWKIWCPASHDRPYAAQHFSQWPLSTGHKFKARRVHWKHDTINSSNRSSNSYTTFPPHENRADLPSEPPFVANYPQPSAFPFAQRKAPHRPWVLFHQGIHPSPPPASHSRVGENHERPRLGPSGGRSPSRASYHKLLCHQCTSAGPRPWKTPDRLPQTSPQEIEVRPASRTLSRSSPGKPAIKLENQGLLWKGGVVIVWS